MGGCIVYTRIRMLLLCHPFIFSFFFLQYSNKIFVTLLSGTLRPRRLKLGQWVDVSCIPESGGYCIFVPLFLAHLSWRLTRGAYSIPTIGRPSIVRRRRPHFQTWISLKPVGQSWSNFMCSIIGVGKRLHKVLGKIGSKLWFPWQQKTFSQLFLIQPFLYLQVLRTCIKSRTSSNFGQIGPLIMELAVLERLKKFP